MEDYHHLQRLSADAEVGKTVSVDIVRRGERRAVKLKIARSPDVGSPTR